MFVPTSSSFSFKTIKDFVHGKMKNVNKKVKIAFPNPVVQKKKHQENTNASHNKSSLRLKEETFTFHLHITNPS